MKRKVGTIKAGNQMTPTKALLKPTPAGYADALLLILENSNSPQDRTWAKRQIIQAFKAAARLNPKAWGKET